MAATGKIRSHETKSSVVECDPVVPGAATRSDPTHQLKLLRLSCFIIQLYTYKIKQ